MLPTNFASCEFKVSTTIVVTLGFFLHCNDVRSQVISDQTANTQVKVIDNTAHIIGGTQAGDNLFHSFKQFSLETNGIASFDHSADINNIFTRITGGNISEIDGLIRTQNDANLFLINPAGIIFGANAQLDVGGSFIATTAEKTIFEDGQEFSAVAPTEPPILTISSPIGLQYGVNGEIAVLPNANRGGNNPTAGLSVKSGNTLALLGGDITINRNNLNAIASNVEISSVRSGKIDLLQNDRDWQFGYDRALEYGRIDFDNRALIDSSGVVNFRGKTINFTASSGIRNFTDLSGNGGIIKLEATESVNLDSSFLFTQVGQLGSNLEQAIAGMGGDIFIEAVNISLANGSIISAGTLSEGAGGNITLEALETIELSSILDRNPSIVSTSTQGMGDGGQIEVNAGKLIIGDGSQIQALAGGGAGGTITVNATESIDISGTGILRSQDRSGNLTETLLNSGFAASSGIENLPLEQQPPGESGSLIMNTPDLTIEDSARISVSNYGLANAGDIKLNIGSLSLDTAGEIIANTASGEGGSINIVAENAITLENNSSVSTTAEQDGNGGNIFIEADNLLLLESDRLSADAQQGSGGNISIDTQGFFIDPNSTITASSAVETQEGTIKIITLDLNSRLFMGFEEYSPLVAEDYIRTGCGAGEDLAKNSFRNIGRGGIPYNPTQEMANLDTLKDFGKANKSSKSFPTKIKNTFEHSPSSDRSIISEANAWKVNSQGKIELVAQQNINTFNYLSNYLSVCRTN
ncbi:filamentous hemagglutinin N-terminal domain-containing protein [Waterburya agarophytonicola K14]|uniref:Filamentous hemagglutinin N-terminal domain-containing protein n=1 Tax=Waterburya agarophytonicola KI4 TaxID=2874699 RepID=A0A964BU42_9CYAN|nr:filamentous hemagglutinin N-terminal domain-containing protein [Waterburya agarophytonicola]MCC0178217.1 filamentous hemagglutinin N-terminal domain-containing protein [Waterburya agarophytonicola KI4]